MFCLLALFLVLIRNIPFIRCDDLLIYIVFFCYSFLGDYALMTKSKARHHAYSAKLDKPFNFNTKPFVLQYEVS